MNKLNQTTVIKSLNRKNDIRIIEKSKKLIILNSKSRVKSNDLGGKSWGKIDFLTNHCGYSTIKVDKFINFNNENKKKRNKKRRYSKMYKAK